VVIFAFEDVCELGKWFLLPTCVTKLFVSVSPFGHFSAWHPGGNGVFDAPFITLLPLEDFLSFILSVAFFRFFSCGGITPHWSSLVSVR